MIRHLCFILQLSHKERFRLRKTETLALLCHTLPGVTVWLQFTHDKRIDDTFHFTRMQILYFSCRKKSINSQSRLFFPVLLLKWPTAWQHKRWFDIYGFYYATQSLSWFYEFSVAFVMGTVPSDGRASPPPWHPKSVLPRAVTIHQLNLKDHKRTSPRASMLLFNKKAMFHSSSVTEPARKVHREWIFPFIPVHERRTRENGLSEIRGYEVTGKSNDFSKGQRSAS